MERDKQWGFTTGLLVTAPTWTCTHVQCNKVLLQWKICLARIPRRSMQIRKTVAYGCHFIRQGGHACTIHASMQKQERERNLPLRNVICFNQSVSSKHEKQHHEHYEYCAGGGGQNQQTPSLPYISALRAHFARRLTWGSGPASSWHTHRGRDAGVLQLELSGQKEAAAVTRALWWWACLLLFPVHVIKWQMVAEQQRFIM